MALQFYVYIMASGKNGTIYTGMTSNLVKRVWEHKEKLVEGFPEKYNVDRLVYYEIYEDVYNARTREKRLKKWRRAWKIELIEKENPNWRDLYPEICQ